MYVFFCRDWTRHHIPDMTFHPTITRVASQKDQNIGQQSLQNEHHK